MTAPEPVYVKHLSDDRVVSVIGRHVCIDRQPEADHLVVIDEAQWIKNAKTQASMAQAALRRAHDSFDGRARAVNERLRNAVWQKVFADGVE